MDVDAETPTTKVDEFPPFENDPQILSHIDEALALVDTDGVQAAVDKLLSLERVNRGAGAAPETAAVCVNILRIFAKRKDWKSLSEYVVMLSKRRAQVKMAIHRMVQDAMSYLDQLDDPTKLAMLETLRDVTSGKIFVELERARLTRALSEMKLAKGDVDTAATIMQEVQVETFGGMQPQEKFDFILEQVRLSLEKNDFIRGAIIAKKIMPRQLNKEGLTDIKLRYYAMMIRIHTRNSDYMQICMAYLERFETCRQLKDEKDWLRELKLASFFVILSPRDSTQVDLLHRIQGFKAMEELPIFVELLKLFSTDELIRWPVLTQTYQKDFVELSTLTKDEVKDEDIKWQHALQERVTEHNLRVLSKYYSRIRVQRLAELLDMSKDDTERKLAAMVSDKKALWARIDRPAEIVSFAKPQSAEAILNGWAANVTSLLDNVEKTCHLVHRETVVQNIIDDE